MAGGMLLNGAQSVCVYHAVRYAVRQEAGRQVILATAGKLQLARRAAATTAIKFGTRVRTQLRKSAGSRKVLADSA